MGEPWGKPTDRHPQATQVRPQSSLKAKYEPGDWEGRAGEEPRMSAGKAAPVGGPLVARWGVAFWARRVLLVLIWPFSRLIPGR